MKPGSVKIVERLKLIPQTPATTSMIRFTRGDRVGVQAPFSATVTDRHFLISPTVTYQNVRLKATPKRKWG